MRNNNVSLTHLRLVDPASDIRGSLDHVGVDDLAAAGVGPLDEDAFIFGEAVEDPSTIVGALVGPEEGGSALQNTRQRRTQHDRHQRLKRT